MELQQQHLKEVVEAEDLSGKLKMLWEFSCNLTKLILRWLTEVRSLKIMLEVHQWFSSRIK